MNQQQLNKKAITLLEILIGIMIIGVLSSFAIPRFYRLIERSRAAEAFLQFKAISDSIERCYAMQGSIIPGSCLDFADLDIDDPALVTNSHFDYTLNNVLGFDNAFDIIATRNALDGGDGTSQISYEYRDTFATGRDIKIYGHADGIFRGIDI